MQEGQHGLGLHWQAGAVSACPFGSSLCRFLPAKGWAKPDEPVPERTREARPKKKCPEQCEPVTALARGYFPPGPASAFARRPWRVSAPSTGTLPGSPTRQRGRPSLARRAGEASRHLFCDSL